MYTELGHWYYGLQYVLMEESLSRSHKGCETQTTVSATASLSASFFRNSDRKTKCLLQQQQLPLRHITDPRIRFLKFTFTAKVI